MQKKIKGAKGITLVALIITVIILLILAGVTISLVIGENGLIAKSKQAEIKTEIEDEKEIIALSQMSVEMSKNDEFSEQTELETEINKQKKATVTKNGDKLIVKFEKSGNRYEIKNGEITEAKRKNEEILSKYEKEEYKEQEIGISSTGNIVDMNLWDYTIEDDYYKDVKILEIMDENGKKGGFCEYYNYNTIGDNTINLARTEIVINTKANIKEYEIYNGYKGSIQNGRIIGEVPQYIKPSNSNEFIEVTKMIATFLNNEELEEAPEIPDSVSMLIGTYIGCTNLIKVGKLPQNAVSLTDIFYNNQKLIVAPEIPESVINMGSSFCKCSSLKEAPKIPNGVKKITTLFSLCSSLEVAPEIPEGIEDLQGVFYECKSLIKAPKIPSTVTKMGRTFEGCSNLKEAPKIPETVTFMYTTFLNCSSLTGDLIIDANPTNYYKCLEGVATNADTKLKLSGSSSKLTEILKTKSENSNIE